MSEQDTENTQMSEEIEQTETNEPQVQDVVPKAELKKVLDEMMSYKKQVKEFESKFKAKEVQEMKDREEWQKIAELKEQEAMSARQEADSLKQSFVSAKKYDALKAAALSHGIKQEALEDLELVDFSDQVAVETTSTGRVNVLGAEDAIKTLKARKPYWFGKSMGNVNHQSPENVSGEAMTMDKIMQLQAEARKTSNWSAYESALKQYRAQKQ